MAAVAYPMMDPWVVSGPGWPDSRVCRPGRPPLPEARVYRRRRAVALLVLVAVVLVTASTLRLARAGPGGGALTTSGSAGAAPAAPAAGTAGRAYVVQPGDTLWSIVKATSHAADPRPEVDHLALQLNGHPLQIGQRLRLP